MQAEVNVALSDEDVARIAKAVVAELKAVGGVVNGNAPKTEEVKSAAEKPAKVTKPKVEAPKPEPETVKGPTREDVIAKLSAVADAKGDRAPAIAVVRKFSPTFDALAESDFQAVIDGLQALLDEPAAEAAGDGW